MPTRQDVKKKTTSAPPTLTVRTFKPPFTFEAYIFAKGNQYNSDADDGYMKGFIDYVDTNTPNEHVSEQLDQGNFTSFVYRRIPDTPNEHMVGIKNPYWRGIIIRYPPESESTPETREQGLEQLKAFLMDGRFSQYPATNIITRDATDEDNYEPLDNYFMDWDIKSFLEEDVAEEDLNSTFYTTYQDFADKVWAGRFKSEFAYSIGFPVTP